MESGSSCQSPRITKAMTSPLSRLAPMLAHRVWPVKHHWAAGRRDARAVGSGARSAKLAVTDAAEKGVPFGLSKSQHESFRILAVADPHDAPVKARHLDAVSVRETKRALHPVRA